MWKQVLSIFAATRRVFLSSSTKGWDEQVNCVVNFEMNLVLSWNQKVLCSCLRCDADGKGSKAAVMIADLSNDCNL